MDNEIVVRVERGNASPEELAAVTAVLMARMAAAGTAAAAAERPTIAQWRRLERVSGFFHTPHSWQAVA